MTNPSSPPQFGEWQSTVSDITLRDWFAGQALIVTANENYGNDWGKAGKEHASRAARRAYALADAMLAARGDVP